MLSRHSDRGALTVPPSGRLHLGHSVQVQGLSLVVPTKLTWVTEEPVPPPRPLHDYIPVGKSTAGPLLSSSALLQTPNLISLISSATMPVLIPSAQVISGPFPIPFPPPPPLLLQRRLPLLEPLLVLEFLIFPSLPFPADFLQRRPQVHRHPHLFVLPVVLFLGERHQRSPRPRNILHSLLHLLRLTRLPIQPPHGDTVFPQVPRQELQPQPLKVPTVLSLPFLMYPEPLTDPPFRLLHTHETCLLAAKAALPLQSLPNARLAPPTPMLMLRLSNPRLRPLIFSRL